MVGFSRKFTRREGNMFSSNSNQNSIKIIAELNKKYKIFTHPELMEVIRSLIDEHPACVLPFINSLQYFLEKNEFTHDIYIACKLNLKYSQNILTALLKLAAADESIAKQYLPFLLKRPQHIETFAKILLDLKKSDPTSYDLVADLSHKAIILESLQIIGLEKFKNYQRLKPILLKYCHVFPRLIKAFPQNIKLIKFWMVVLNEHPDLVSRLQPFACEENLWILKTFEILKNNNLFNKKNATYFLKNSNLSQKMCEALTFLEAKALLNAGTMEYLKFHGDTADAAAKKLLTYFTDVTLNEGLSIKLPALLPAQDYTPAILRALGEACLQACFAVVADDPLPAHVVQRVGEFFVNFVNGKSDIIPEHILTDLSYIKQQNYVDPDTMGENNYEFLELDKFVINLKLSIFLRAGHIYENYYRILKIIYSALGSDMLPEQAQSYHLAAWYHCYVKAVDLLKVHQQPLCNVTLKTFFPHIDMLVNDLAISKTQKFCQLFLKPFKTFTEQELVLCVLSVKSLDSSKYLHAKQQCLIALKYFLKQKPVLNYAFNSFFKKKTSSKNNDAIVPTIKFKSA
jgi:hypothetical protein